jgi:metal-sulfur cluster biosynthetic enzyme
MSKEDPMAKQAVKEYLRELDQELRDLPRSRRQELLGEIHEHIDSALAEAPAHDEAEVRNVLDRLGDPSDIAEEARHRFGVPKVKSGALEIAAVILLPIGGIILPVIGWLIGMILLWSSRVWTTGEKLAGTLLFPGGLLLPAGLGLGAVWGQSCSGVIQNADQLITGAGQEIVSCDGPSTLYTIGAAILMAVLVIVPIATAVVLARRMRARTAPA